MRFAGSMALVALLAWAEPCAAAGSAPAGAPAEGTAGDGGSTRRGAKAGTAAPAPDGAPCSLDGDCRSGLCVMSWDVRRCGSRACPLCQVLDEDGSSCVNAMAGTDPKDECSSDPAACVADACDGAGSCRAQPGTPCGPPGCAQGLATRWSCDAAGTCQAASESCGAYACAGGVCLTRCRADADCASADEHCSERGTCEPRRADGSPCTTSGNCRSGKCEPGRAGKLCARVVCRDGEWVQADGRACERAPGGALAAWSIGLALGGGARWEPSANSQPLFVVGLQSELLLGPRRRYRRAWWWAVGPVLDARFGTPDRWQAGGGLEALGQLGTLGLSVAGGVGAAFPGPEVAWFGTLGLGLRDWLPGLGRCPESGVCVRPTAQLALFLDVRHGQSTRSTQLTAGLRGNIANLIGLLYALANRGWGGENFPAEPR